MQAYQREFIQLAVDAKVLLFGEFTLKSGRVSPYFFNAGLFNTGATISAVANAYAASIMAGRVDYDVLYGPAYKGIPLVASLASALYNNHSVDKPWSFNRKEAKDHGEGGVIVGAPLSGGVLVVDDVVSAGTSVRESTDIINAAGAQVAGVAIMLDRQERGTGDSSAVQEVEATLKVPVLSIVTLNEVIEFLSEDAARAEQLDAVGAYRERYGVDN